MAKKFNKYGGTRDMSSGGGGMGDMLKQAQKMQEDMARLQEELEERTETVTAGGGAISVTVSGKKEIQEIIISPEVVDSDDVEMLQDLICAAVNEALRKIDEVTSGEMAKITGGISLPGLM
jgi:DNA-binding YbaB/EbfC family protein